MQTLTARTALCGIVLHPAGHTRSPAMHNAAFRAMGLDAVYLAFDVAAEALAPALGGARALGIRQLAVSLPHKQAALAHADALDEHARAIGALNTLTLRAGHLHGTNTDWLGALRALERAGAKLDGARAVVLGAGGTARAVVYGLLRGGAQVTVLNRSTERARTLAAELGAVAGGGLEALTALDFDVLVNTTSVGLGSDRSPIPARAHRASSVVLDAVYEPPRTRLLRDAEAAGARTVSGKWMLVYQAAEQIHAWTQREAPIEVMADAFDRAAQA